MSFSSAEIAGQTGQYQTMYAGQYSHSGMISGLMGMSGPPQVQGEALAGGAMNRVGAIAGPVAGLGLGMLGLDPMSLGLKAGMGAYGMGAGAMGGVAAGLGVAGLAAIPMAAMSYAGSQIMTGGRQQQQFNASMRSSFPFNSSYGQGFSTSQLGAMGSDLRHMAGGVGPGGEMSSFRELSQLASNMGRMGMGTGVRDVQQFKQKFSEMLQTVKTVASELGTTLEQAQQAMVSMKGSGVFRTGDQIKMAMQMRQFSVSGGLATSELASMASIGSQISRSVGGRGSAGAFAGMKTLGTIGSALQTGVLGEEDIYQATGMSGAEGRQALATRQMELSANFLKTNKGRYFLASVAGSNGSLDAGSVNAWMGGGMDVEETRGQAHRNLRGVGRANFIRNEGRLRGAAMEKFGGLLPAMALQQWGEGKNIDINSMGDREMLFASRQLGMGMDELQATIKEAKNLPALMQSQQTEGQIDQSLRGAANQRKTHGVEGMKRKFEQAREKIQSGLQELGANFYSQSSDMVERYLNKLSGTAVEEINRDAIKAYKESGSLSQLHALTGVGRSNRLGGLGGGRTTGGIGSQTSFFGEGGLLASIGESGYDQGVRAGFSGKLDAVRNMRPGAKREAALGKAASFMNDFYTNMLDPNLTGGSSFSGGFQDKLREAYAEKGIAGKQGMDRANALQSFLETEAFKGNTEARSALMQLQNAPESQKGAIALGIERSGKVASGAQISNGVGSVPSLFAAGSHFSQGEAAEAAGGILGKEKGLSGKLVAAGLLATTGVGVPAALGLVATALVEHVQDKAERQKAGQFMLSAEGQAFTRAIASGSPGEVGKAFAGIQDKYTELQDKMARDPSSVSPDEMRRVKMMYGAAKVARDAGSGGVSDDMIKKEARNLGIDAGDLGAALGSINNSYQEQTANNIRSIARSVGDTARNRKAEIAATGLGNNKNLNEDMLSYVRQINAESQLQGNETGSGLARAAGLEDVGFTERHNREARYWGMDKKDLMSGAKANEGMGFFSLAREERGIASEKNRIFSQMRRGGVAGAALQTLGLKVDRGNLGMLKGLSGDKLSAALGDLIGQTGISAGENDPLQKELLAAMSSKDKNEQARLLSGIQRGTSEGGRELQENQKKQNEQQDRDKNPLLDSIDSTLKEILERSTRTAQGTEKIVGATSELNSKTPSSTDPVSGTASTPQPGK